jgi:hypothetical protein
MADHDLASGDGSGATSGEPPAAPVPEPHRLLGVLADAAKLRVFAALVLAPDGRLSAAEAAEAAGAGGAETAKALDKLAGVGLVRAVDAGYAANPAVLRESLGELSRRREQEQAGRFATDDPETRSVLLNSFRDGKLVYLPEKLGKRRIVLDEIAQRFEPGTRYAEAEVTMVLSELYPDHAALRRYLVDCALLTRKDGFYWRTGGTVPA